MPPRIRPRFSSPCLPLRSNYHHHAWSRSLSTTLPRPIRPSPCLSSSNKLPTSQDDKGPNTDTLPDVNQEAQALNKAKGEPGPDLSQGTPIQEVVKRDKEAQEKLPKVMKDQLANSSSSSSKRSFSTWSRSSANQLQPASTPPDSSHVARLAAAADAHIPTALPLLNQIIGDLPPLKPDEFYTRRYPSIIEQLAGLMMRHGKKAMAHRNIAILLNKLRTSPPPKIATDRPLLPGHPPPTHLPLNPITYLTLAVDSLAPLIRLRSIKGAAGGGASLMIPVPLAVRRRRHVAIKWIVEAANKKTTRIAFRGSFGSKVADEIIAIVEGKSALWDRRVNVHKQGVVARANVKWKPPPSKKR